jgi:hypothetical protein
MQQPLSFAHFAHGLTVALVEDANSREVRDFVRAKRDVLKAW